MKVKLIRYTPEPDRLCGEAAAICTAADSPIRALRGALASGHESVVEHACFTFRVESVSRVLLAQFTRHRLASFSVESQRYCGIAPEWIIPLSIAAAGLKEQYISKCDEAFEFFCELLVAGVPEEDARYVIPQGVACNLIVTMNARELLHFFELRCCNRAQWEIRDLADAMTLMCKAVAPEIFKRAGCACQQGRPCPEGKRSCGHPREVLET